MRRLRPGDLFEVPVTSGFAYFQYLLSHRYGAKEITLFAVYKDNRGDLWLGTHEAGAYKFDGKAFGGWRPGK